MKGDPTQVVPLELHPNFSVSSLMTKHRWQKSIKGKQAWPSILRFPSVPLERKPSFFNKQMGRLGFLTFLKLKRAGRNVWVGMDALLYKLQRYCLCSRHVYVTFWRWPLLMGPSSQLSSSRFSLKFHLLKPALSCRLIWVDMKVAWLPSVCLRFSKNLSRTSFPYLSDGFWQDGLFPVCPQASV